MSECGAKTRAGGTCKRKPMENGRCHYHGGKSTGPPKNNQNARKHGFYSSVLRDEEKEDYGTAKIEDALAMAYIQHKRALNAERDDLAEKMLGRIAQLEKTKAELEGHGEQESEFDELEIVEYEESQD